MTKHYKAMMDELINKMDEDAPANATGTAVAGTGDDNSVHTKKSELDKMKRRDPLSTAKGYVGSVVPISTKIKESDDNNNVVLKGVLDKIDSIEIKIDEMTETPTEIVEEQEPQYKTFRDKYNA